jgi:hypothetical protein
MKKLIFISIIILVTASCVSNSTKPKAISQVADVKMKKSKSKVQNYILKSDSIDISLSIIKGKKKIEFEININDNNNNAYKIKNKADLILDEDENGDSCIQEGTPILDSSTNQEYVCDSTFGYYSDKLYISFGFEEKTNKRLCLILNNSKISFIKDVMVLTLYRKN